MILLASTSDKIRLVTSAAGEIDVHASWVDNNAGSITPGRTNPAAITSATTTDIVASPGSSTYRAIKYLSIINHHASISNDVEVYHTDGTNENELIRTSLAPYESLTFVDGSGWERKNSAGITVSGANAGAPDIQTFTSGGTWTKPTTFTPKVVIVEMIGAGGGGGAGASLATAVVAKGGGGGGGGAYMNARFAASDLSSTVAVGIGAGGSPGARGAAGAAGGSGGAGGNSTFGSYLTAYGGGGGAGGAISAATTGGGGGGGAGGAGGSTSGTSGGTGGVPTSATNGSGGQGVTGTAAVSTTANAENGGGGGAGSPNPPAAASLGGSSLRGGAGGGLSLIHI